MAVKAYEWKGGDNMRKALKSIADKMGTAGKVQIGFFEDATYPPEYTTRQKFRIGGGKRKPLPVAQVAFWNIYGTKTAPARDFIGAAVRANQGYWPKDIADLAKAHGYDARKVLELMGESIKDDIVHYIEVWSQPANAKLTVKIKGFNKPLTDEGIMKSNVGYRVTGV